LTDRDDGRRSGQRLCDAVRLLLQISRNFGELGEGGLEVVDDFGGDNVGIRL
jgi:hypothetical protein